jgi:hypothetical protein
MNYSCLPMIYFKNIVLDRKPTVTPMLVHSAPPDDSQQ